MPQFLAIPFFAFIWATKASQSLLSVGMTLNTDLVALGASAATYYPNIADVIETKLTVPHHVDVAVPLAPP